MNLRVMLLFVVGIGAVLPSLGFAPAPEKKRVEVSKNVFFEKDGDVRRVILSAKVVLRDGQLEGLLTRKGKKEHEYILAVDADARAIHAALLAAGAKPGKPVQFEPKYLPASGSPIKVTLRYKKDKQTVSVPAQEWLRPAKGKKALEENWVFAGSREVPDFEDKTKKHYLANQGDLICVCNMESALLDLPIASPRAFDDRMFDANTDKIPAVGTEVEIVLEVTGEKKEK